MTYKRKIGTLNASVSSLALLSCLTTPFWNSRANSGDGSVWPNILMTNTCKQYFNSKSYLQENTPHRYYKNSLFSYEVINR